MYLVFLGNTHDGYPLSLVMDTFRVNDPDTPYFRMITYSFGKRIYDAYTPSVFNVLFQPVKL